MGKTSLFRHVNYQLEHLAYPYSVVYVDLLPTMNVNEMLNHISSALIRLKKDEKNFFEKILSVLSSLRPRITIDSLTGEPSIELMTQSNAEIQTGLDHLLSLIRGIRNNVVFMFDEFQQISNYPEKNIEQILRSIIQTYPVIPFIFSGSSKHQLENMFLSAARPFYQSSELIYLDRIQEDDYRKFITDRFLYGNKIITNDSLTKIFEWTRLHTYYVQYICNILFEIDEKTIETEHINSVFHRVLTDSELQYFSYRNLLPHQQFKLLQAIAVEDGVTHPTSGKFIMRYNLTSASSVNTSLKALQEKEMIMQEKGKWLVYDVFFSRWLEHHYRKQ